jgi:hypothetical protein
MSIKENNVSLCSLKRVYWRRFSEEMGMLEEGGYDLPAWEEEDGG